MSEVHHEHQKSHDIGAAETVSRLAQGFTGLFLLYGMVAEIVVKLGQLSDGAEAMMATAPAWAIGISVIIPLPDPLAELIIACIVTGVITYYVLKYVCSQEWVKETVEIEECWEEVKWYNPFSWVKAIVCTVVEVVKWVLKQICKWVEVLVVILVVTCIIISVVIVLA